MAINYCVNCGEKLEASALVCHACGEEVPREISARSQDAPEEVSTRSQDAPDEEDFSSFADFTGFDVITSDPGVAPAERMFMPPDKTDVMAPVKGMRQASEYRAPKEEKNYLRKSVKIAFGVAAAILLAAGIGLLAQPNTLEGIQKQLDAATSAQEASETSEASSEEGMAENAGEAETEQASGANKSSVSSLAVSDAAAMVDEDTAFEYLTQVYDSLQSYNERVYSCLQTFNGAIFASDKSQREAAAGIANSLLAEMEKEIGTLDAMNIGRASAIYDDYENVRNLLNDQYKRLSSCTESWEISLSFDDPYNHQNEVLAPIARDTGASGQNVYLEDFDANFWGSRPTR